MHLRHLITPARGLAFGIVLSFTGALVAQRPAPATTADGDRDSITLLRWINTVQARRAADTGGFASLSAIAGAQDIPSPVSPMTVTNEIGQWQQRQVVLVVSGTGRQYAVKLAPEVRCGWTFFTDESGVISKGRALGCDADAPAP